MKYLIFTFVAFTLGIPFAQCQTCLDNFYFNFDSSDNIRAVFCTDTMAVNYVSWIMIDTTSYHRNQWQIGRPSKTVFNAALSAPNALVTDTLHPCLANDTSALFLIMPRYVGGWGMISFGFHYRIEKNPGDTLLIEASVDSGNHWINIYSDSTLFNWYSPPNLSTNTVSWDSILLYPTLAYDSGIYLTMPTYMVKLTLITGTDITPRDGWMIDNLNINYPAENTVFPISKNPFSSLFPVPVSDILHVTSSEYQNNITITDATGKLWFNCRKTTPNSEIDMRAYPTGLYFIGINNEPKRKIVKL